jgi:hypothetical protein
MKLSVLNVSSVVCRAGDLGVPVGHQEDQQTDQLFAGDRQHALSREQPHRVRHHPLSHPPDQLGDVGRGAGAHREPAGPRLTRTTAPFAPRPRLACPR